MIVRLALPATASLITLFTMSGCSSSSTAPRNVGTTPALRTTAAQVIERQVAPPWSDTKPIQTRIKDLHTIGGEPLVLAYAKRHPEVLAAAYRDLVMDGADPTALLGALGVLAPGPALPRAEQHRLRQFAPDYLRWRGAIILLRKAIDQLSNEHGEAAEQNASKAQIIFTELADPWWAEEAALVMAVASASASASIGVADEAPSEIHAAYRRALTGQPGTVLLAESLRWHRGQIDDPARLISLTEQAWSADLPQLELRLALAAASNGFAPNQVLVARALLNCRQLQSALVRCTALRNDPGIRGAQRWQLLSIHAEVLERLGHVDESIAVGLEALRGPPVSDDVALRLATAIRLLRQQSDAEADRLLKSASAGTPADQRRLLVARALSDAAAGRNTAADLVLQAVFAEALTAGDWSLIATNHAFAVALQQRASK